MPTRRRWPQKTTKRVKLDPGEGIQAQVEIARAQKQDAAAIDEILKKALDVKATTYDLHMIQGNYLASKKRDAEE